MNRYRNRYGGQVYNLHRFYSISYVWDVTRRLEIYNRSTIYEDESSFTGREYAEVPFNTDGKYPSALQIDDCDSATRWKGAKLDTSNYAQGKGSLKTAGTDLLVLEKKFPAIDLSAYRDGYVYLNIYIEDTSLLAGNSFFELISSGTCDKKEIGWGLGNSLFKSGWNEIILPLSDGVFTGGEPDFAKINYMRIYMFTNGENTLQIDNIKIGLNRIFRLSHRQKRNRSVKIFRFYSIIFCCSTP